MKHDAAHCADYDEAECPGGCYRAKLTRELREINCPLPTAWAHFAGTQYCVREVKNGNE